MKTKRHFEPSINEGYIQALTGLEEDELYQSAVEVADKTYMLLREMPEEEKYGMITRARQYGFDLTASIAEALGSINPQDVEYYFGMTRKNAFGLKNIAHVSALLELGVNGQDLGNKLTAFLKMLDQRIATVRHDFRLKQEENKHED